jgi:glucosamine kinase
MLIGIDIGGTKTRILATGGPEPQDQSMPTSSWREHSHSKEDVARLLAAVLALSGGRQPDILVAGAHGCDTDEERLALQERLARHSSGVVLVLNDSELLLPASGEPVGISVISGTGSIAVSRNHKREMIAAGGWGWYLGDEGSASGLVRDAARAVRASVDKGGPLDPLGLKLVHTLGIESVAELGRALSELGSASKIGNLAPLVFEAARAGSAIARHVIAEGGKALADLALLLVQKGAPGNHVVTGGGVITHQLPLFDAFERALGAAAPQLRLTLLKAPPVTGAMVLARQLQQGQLPRHLPFPHRAGQISHKSDWRAV